MSVEQPMSIAELNDERIKLMESILHYHKEIIQLKERVDALEAQVYNSQQY